MTRRPHRTSRSGRARVASPMDHSRPNARCEPIGPATSNQTAQARTRAAAIISSPRPSRRCAGSMSRAVAASLPTERAIQPVARAVPIHRPRRPRTRASAGPGIASARRRLAAARAEAGLPTRAGAVFLAVFLTAFFAAFLAAFFTGFLEPEPAGRLAVVRLRAAFLAPPEVLAIMPHTLPPASPRPLR